MRRGPIQQGGIGSYPTSYWGTPAPPIPIVPQGQDLQNQINALNTQLVAKNSSQDEEYRRSVNLMNRQLTDIMELSLLYEPEKEEVRQMKEIEGETFDISKAVKKIGPGRPKGQMTPDAIAKMMAKRQATMEAKKQAGLSK